MATITPVTTSGSALGYAAASVGGDTVAFGTTTTRHILVRNASGSTITVTLTAVSPCNQGVLHNQVVSCPVGDTPIIPSSAVIDSGSTTPANRGNVGLTYSANTSITVAAVAS